MAVPFTKYTISSSQYKVIRHTKRQKIQFEETKEMPKVKNTVTRRKDALMGSSIDWAQLKKEL